MIFSSDTWWIVGIVFSAAIAVISFFLKRLINQADNHEKDISEIKRTYVTKDELKELKEDTKQSIDKLSQDVEEIKETCLTKKEFYQSISELKQENRDQNQLIMELIKESRHGG